MFDWALCVPVHASLEVGANTQSHRMACDQWQIHKWIVSFHFYNQIGINYNKYSLFALRKWEPGRVLSQVRWAIQSVRMES